MLTILPKQWIQRLSATGYSYSNGLYYGSGVYSGALREPYEISFRPSTGKRSYTGDRPTTHYQVHGFGLLGVTSSNEGRLEWGQPTSLSPSYPRDTYPLIRLKPVRGVFFHPAGKETYYWCASRINGWPCLSMSFSFYSRRNRRTIQVVFVCYLQCNNFTSTTSPVLINGCYVVSQVNWLSFSATSVQHAGSSSVKWVPPAPSRLGGYTPISAPYDTGHYYMYGVPKSQQLAFFRQHAKYFRQYLSNIASTYKAFVLRDTISISKWYAIDYLQNSGYKPNYGLRSSELHLLREQLMNTMVLTRPEKDIYRISDATVSAVESANSFEGNMAPYLKELIELSDTVTDLYDLLHGKVSMETVSKLWLSLRYGLRLTAQDSLELAEALTDNFLSQPALYTRLRGRDVQEDSYVSVILYADPDHANTFAKVCNFLYEWDLFPSFQNIWDIIPYSFVADWFVSVEDFLVEVDANLHASVLNIFQALLTYKMTWVPGSGNLGGVKGSVYFSYYTRELRKEPPDIIPHFTGSLPSWKNWLDGVSLIISRH